MFSFSVYFTMIIFFQNNQYDDADIDITMKTSVRSATFKTSLCPVQGV